jgi:hypothetical protein
MTDHRWILEPYKSQASRHRCPGCNKNKTFALYIDQETNDIVGDRVGRCNREIECAYHYTPSQYFKDNGLNVEYTPHTPTAPKPQPPTSFIDPELFEKSLTAYKANNFIKFLNTIFDQTTIDKLVSKYFIGTSSHWPGATVFWQIDQQGKIRTGKVMLYNPSTGKRVKEPFNHLTWTHKVLKLSDFNLKLCLFGEHLLKTNPGKPVAVVESEKSAIISSVYLPEFIWLAVGGLSQLTAERCKSLKGRTVVLYPDLNAYEKWKIKGDEFGFKTSKVLESKATEEEKKQGLDIADYLLRVNVTQMSNKSADFSHFNTKNDTVNVSNSFNPPTQACEASKVSVPPEVLKLRAEFERLELAGAIVSEAVIIDGIGSIADLREFVGHLWRQLVTRRGNAQQGFAIKNLQTIREYYNKKTEHYGAEQHREN